MIRKLRSHNLEPCTSIFKKCQKVTFSLEPCTSISKKWPENYNLITKFRNSVTPREFLVKRTIKKLSLWGSEKLKHITQTISDPVDWLGAVTDTDASFTTLNFQIRSLNRTIEPRTRLVSRHTSPNAHVWVRCFSLLASCRNRPTYVALSALNTLYFPLLSTSLQPLKESNKSSTFCAEHPVLSVTFYVSATLERVK
jgi:hypothetical protein